MNTAFVFKWTKKLEENYEFVTREVFISFQGFIGENKECSCTKFDQIWQERVIYLTWNFAIRRIFDIHNLFICELLVTDEYRKIIL